MAYLLKNCRIWGKDEIADVFVDGRRIICIAPNQSASDTREIDLTGKTLLPGFFNTHVHLYGVAGPLPDELIRRFVTGGVTTVRDMGMTSPLPYESYQEWLSQRRSSDFPTIITAGKFLSGQNTYGTTHPSGARIGYVIEETPEGAAAAVDTMADAGADLIKSGLDYGMDPEHPLDYLSEDVFRAICRRAKERGIPSAAHITKADNMVKAAAWGLTECAHAATDHLSDSDIAAIKASGMAVNTTMSIFDMVSSQTGEAIMEDVISNVGRLYRAGVPMSAGTDFMHEAEPWQTAGIPVHELRLLVKAGLSVEEAIGLATIDAARACGVEKETGSIEAGKLADLIAVEGPIDETFTALEPGNILFVMHNGQIIKQ